MNPLLMPVVAVQGTWIRTTLKMASPATGPTSGTVGEGSGPPLRIAILGESTAAGCGVDTHDDGFPGCLARELAVRTQRSVSWEVAGQFGATARRIRYRLLPRLGERLDVAVLLAGANDVFTRRTPEQWRDNLVAILDSLTDRADDVVMSGLPPFAAFPSLPTALGRYLAERAAALDEVSRQVCAEAPRTTWIGIPEVPIPNFFGHDRFHPSAAGYRSWALAIADHIAR
ncbi:SGNH/GDSL hydrolase family protein [Plantactinospora solaniradicis]|uniref:SGNH/GDSL hydrolase family protein n=1 Tax=Plantactinospora solaniradicis TaxID=1723736 RepID=A0ABW1K6Z9_9ACTN